MGGSIDRVDDIGFVGWEDETATSGCGASDLHYCELVLGAYRMSDRWFGRVSEKYSARLVR